MVELLILLASPLDSVMPSLDYSDSTTVFFLLAPFAFLSLIPSDRISNRLRQLNGQTGQTGRQLKARFIIFAGFHDMDGFPPRLLSLRLHLPE